MDRVTRKPVFNSPYFARISGLALDGDTSYTYEMVGIGQEGRGTWGRDQWQAGPRAARTELDTAGPETTYRRWVTCEDQCTPQRPWMEEDKEEEEVKPHFWGAPTGGTRRHLDGEHWTANPQDQGMLRSSISPGYRTPSPGEPRNPKPTTLEDNAVDTEQINFKAAREQFLSLERANSGIPPAPQSKGATPRVSQTPKAWNRPPEAKVKAVAPAKPPRRTSTPTEENRARAPWSDRAEAPRFPEAAPTPQEKPVVPETPIEREIRLALEREADLRAQRGMQRSASHQELVQIPARPSLLALPDVRPDARPERRRASLYVQWDLAQETQREAEHRRHELQLGRALTPDSPPRSPSPAQLRRAWSSDSLLDASPGRAPAEARAGARKVQRIPPDAYHPFMSPSSPPRVAGPPASSSSSSFSSSSGLGGAGPAQVSKAPAPGSWGPVLESSRKSWGPQEEGSAQGSRGPRRTTDGAVVKKKYFLLRPLRFGVSAVAPRKEAPLKEAPRDAAPAWRLQRSGSSELLEREVENVLRRERELEEERRSALYPEVFSPSPDFGDSDPDSRSSSRASGITGSYSVSESLTSPIRLHSGLVWTAEEPAEASEQRSKDRWYAGLNPSDYVNSEILESTRVPHHKSMMAQRWESGIYFSEDEN
ncbi:mitotic interactor and substrate of PLK1 [Sorex fumeus]|uniref:mitotic interactor and substrate of PLK1 n=1 Tax=Sorex fumeus TaxID=62283 RepID=UPI0024AD65A9|nr:mitotic interactor and substrate of PLK1 [Sorex fumeus]